LPKGEQHVKRSLFILATSLLFLPIATAQPPGKAGTSPTFILVESVLPDQELIHLNHVEMVPQIALKPVVETVVINGQEKQVTKVVQFTAYVPVTKTKPWSAKDAKAYDVAGNGLTKAALFQRLKAGDAVLWLPTGLKLDPMYQKLFSKDAIVLTPAGGP
jgi:hypothetical protein